jgi:hypothetical protein
MKKLLEMKLDTGETVFMEIEDSYAPAIRGGECDYDRSGERNSESARLSFNQAISCIKPVADTLLASLKDINTPAEITLEFGVTFNAKAGVVFTSVESEASFKVGITWKNA